MVQVLVVLGVVVVASVHSSMCPAVCVCDCVFVFVRPCARYKLALMMMVGFMMMMEVMVEMGVIMVEVGMMMKV